MYLSRLHRKYETTNCDQAWSNKIFFLTKESVHFGFSEIIASYAWKGKHKEAEHKISLPGRCKSLRVQKKHMKISTLPLKI